MFGLWLALLLTTTPITDQQQEERQFEVNLKPTIIPSLGVALKPRGFLASGGDPIFASIFLDIPIPQFGQRSCKTSNIAERKVNFPICSATMQLVAKIKAKLPGLVDDAGLINNQNRAEALECLTSGIQDEEVLYTHMQIERNSTISLCLHSKTKLNILSRKFKPGEEARDYPNWAHLYSPSERRQAFSIYWKKIRPDLLTDWCNEQLANETDVAITRMFRQSWEQDIEQLWNQSYTTYKNLVLAYDLVPTKGTNSKNETGRNKRNAAVAAAVAIPIIGLAATMYESYQTRKYIKRLEAQFNEFSEETVRVLQRQVTFNEEVIKVYESIHQELDYLSCKVDTIGYQILKEKQLNAWKNHVKLILSGILDNRLTMNVLPEIIRIEDLEELVKNPMFQGTIYQEIPTTILTQGKITLVNMTRKEESFRFHFILNVPALKPGSIYPRFETVQVGVKAPDRDQCMKFDLPNEVYRIGDKLYEVTADSCYYRSDSLKICSKPSDDQSLQEHQEVPCLNKQTTCDIQITTCKTRATFTTAGVITFSEEEVAVVLRNSSVNSLAYQSNGETGVRFYSWDQYRMIIVGPRLIQTVREPTLHITLEPKEVIEWNDFVREAADNITRRDLNKLVDTVTKQKTNLQNLEDLVTTPVEIETSWVDLGLKFAGVTSLAILVALIVWLICARILYRMRKYKKEVNRQREGDAMALRYPLGIPLTQFTPRPHTTSLPNLMEASGESARGEGSRTLRKRRRLSPLPMTPNQMYEELLMTDEDDLFLEAPEPKPSTSKESEPKQPKRPVPELPPTPMPTISAGKKKATKPNPQLGMVGKPTPKQSKAMLDKQKNRRIDSLIRKS